MAVTPSRANEPTTLRRRTFLAVAGAWLWESLVPQGAAAGELSFADELASTNSQAQLALARRVLETLARLGEPADAATLDEVNRLEAAGNLSSALARAHEVLDRRVLLVCAVNPEGQVALARGAAEPALVQGGWRLFLARIDNSTLVPGRLSATSPESTPRNGIAPNDTANSASIGGAAPVATSAGDVQQRWLDLLVFDGPQLSSELMPLPRDYKILQLYAGESGNLSAHIRTAIGAGRNDQGEHDAVTVPFAVAPAHSVLLRIRDADNQPTVCSLLIRDAQGRVYPSPTRRPLPDLYFQKQIYRADGETLQLAAGSYQVDIGRGPEYLRSTLNCVVSAQGDNPWQIALQRWIDPRTRGWFSGDHHIHAAGCAHYMHPTEGVAPEIMARQVRGEGLSIGAVLTWGPGFYTQKRNFSGHDDVHSGPGERLHYDLEVSGFPSSHCGHLVLLQMQGMDYPATERIEQWPSSNTPVLRWARQQGAITGYAHSGWGLIVNSTELPNDLMPAFDGIGANDYIVTVTAGLIDFISGCDTPIAAELNIWYHTLNVGLRTRIAGETDWPCIFDERVGMGRSYVKLEGPLSYQAWCQGLKSGRSYISEGRAHLMDFSCRSASAQTTVGGGDLSLPAPGPITVEVQAAARLEPQVNEVTEAIRNLGPEDKPYWHLERARLGTTRQVAVQLLVNGLPVETRTLEADGVVRGMTFSFMPQFSCWIALRITGAAHTNPIWITIADAPIRVKRSATWCRQAVDQCWKQKVLRIRESERDAEAEIYASARLYYDRIIAECKT